MAALPVRQQQAARRRGNLLPISTEQIPALTAAATRATRAKSGMMRRLIQPWQARALSYYDLVGECWNAAQFYSRSLKQVRIYAATRDEQGELVEIESGASGSAGKALEQVQRIQDPGGGGYSQLMDSYGRLRFLIGEGYFLITNTDGDDEGWQFVSPDELRLTGDGVYTRFAAPSLPAEELVDIPDTAFKPVGNEALVYRSWRPHPRFSLLADSPIRAVLDILEELVLLTLAVRGTAKSRLVRNGILYIPDEISPVLPSATGDEDMSQDPFMERLQQQLLSGLINPGTAAAVAPALMRGPAEFGEHIRWIQVSNPLETYPEEGLRTEAIRRFATGIEMPAELLLGTADVNHWGAWLIDDQAAKNYIFPACQDLVDDLTTVFLRPTLRADKVPDWADFVIGYDASAITDEYDVTPDPAVNPQEQETGAEGGPQTGSEVDEGPPDRPAAPPEADQQLAVRRAKAETACTAALVRSRQLAGNRLRTAIRGLEPGKLSGALTPPDQLENVPNAMLARALGPEWVRAQTGRSELALVAGTGAFALELLQAAGINGETGASLAALVEQHGAKAVYGTATRSLPANIQAFIARVIT